MTAFFGFLSSVFRGRRALLLENLALRQQLAAYSRTRKRPALRTLDRVFWVWLSKLWPTWSSALVIVKPQTVLRWHRQGFKLYWRWRSRPRHAGRLVMEIGTRRIVHFNVTEHPTLDWVKLQIRDIVAFGQEPRLLLHDNDGVLGQYGWRKNGFRCHLDRWLATTMGIEGIPTPYRAPNANGHIERFHRTLRQDALNHFIFLGAAHVRRVAESSSSTTIEHGRHRPPMRSPTPTPSCSSIRRQERSSPCPSWAGCSMTIAALPEEFSPLPSRHSIADPAVRPRDRRAGEGKLCR